MKTNLWVLLGWIRQHAVVSLRLRKQERAHVLRMRGSGFNFGPIRAWVLFLFVLMLLTGVAPSCGRLPFYIGWVGVPLPVFENVPVELAPPDNASGYLDFTDVRVPVVEAIDRPRVRPAGLRTAESSRQSLKVMRPAASSLAHTNEDVAIAHDSRAGISRSIPGVHAGAARKLDEPEVPSETPDVQTDEPTPEMTVAEPERPKAPAPTLIVSARELCGDHLDNDGDGLTDTADSDCPAATGRVPEHDREPAGGREVDGSGGR